MTGLIGRIDPYPQRKFKKAPRRGSRPVPRWTALGADVAGEIQVAYADASPQNALFRGAWYNEDPEAMRKMEFLTSHPVTSEQLHEFLKYVGNYTGKFYPKRISTKVYEADPGSVVWIGRESSPVLYIRPSTDKGGGRLYKAFENLANEVGFVSEAPSKQIGDPEYKPGTLLRVWWD